MRVQLLTNAVATGAGPTQQMLRDGLKSGHINQGVFQVTGIGTGTVAIQGRADPNAAWVDIATFTADGTQAVQLMREMRANVSAYTSGTINAWMNV
jgi:hypothetical protein